MRHVQFGYTDKIWITDLIEFFVRDAPDDFVFEYSAALSPHEARCIDSDEATTRIEVWHSGGCHVAVYHGITAALFYERAIIDDRLRIRVRREDRSVIRRAIDHCHRQRSKPPFVVFAVEGNSVFPLPSEPRECRFYKMPADTSRPGWRGVM